MRLICPHCLDVAAHAADDFPGEWVVCPACETPFGWRDARADVDGVQAPDPTAPESSARRDEPWEKRSSHMNAGFDGFDRNDLRIVITRILRAPAVPVLVGLTAVLGSAASAGAQESPGEVEKPLRITAVNLSADDARHQALAGRGLDSESLLPGDVVQYRLRFTNVKDIRVRDVVIDDPVPEGLEYVDGSASANQQGVDIQYSIDGGRTYSNRPTMQKVVDGKGVEVPAPPESYTHIRWIVRDWIEPGSTLTASFRTRLPEPEDRGDDTSAPADAGSNDGESAADEASGRGSDDQ